MISNVGWFVLVLLALTADKMDYFSTFTKRENLLIPLPKAYQMNAMMVRHLQMKKL